MNLFSYIKKYDYTFSEKGFNEVDNLVFSVLSYLDFNNLVSNNKNDKITIEKLSELYFLKYPKYISKEGMLVKKYTYKLFKLLGTSKRYKDVLVYNYTFVHNEDIQFGAVTFEFDNLIYISFEGTDEHISGWKEDFYLTCKFPVPAHIKAISYLNKYLFTNKKIIVGGHSKGGNLALVAVMYAFKLVKDKIIKIYSNDGPGLRRSELESKKYKKIKDKYTHIVPNTSFIGMLLNNENDYVVKANGITGFTHLPFTWQIEENVLIKSTLSKSSEVIRRGTINWLEKYTYDERELFINELFKGFHDNNITSLNQLRTNPSSIISFLKSLSQSNDIVKKMSSDLIRIIRESIKE